MSPSVKRRQSFLQRVRPFTAGGEQPAVEPQPPLPYNGVFDVSSKAGGSVLAHHEPGPVESGAFLPLPASAIDPRDFDVPPESTLKRHHSKSFSSIRGLRSVVRRLSVSMKQNKSSKQAAPVERDIDQTLFGKENQLPEMKVATHNRPILRRQSLSSLGLPGWTPPPHAVLEPIPGNRGEPPVLPNDLSHGAAARAAAAAQNEQIKLERMASNTESFFLDENLDAKRTFDSESGIEINIQDASDSEQGLEFVRRGKVDCAMLILVHG